MVHCANTVDASESFRRRVVVTCCPIVLVRGRVHVRPVLSCRSHRSRLTGRLWVVRRTPAPEGAGAHRQLRRPGRSGRLCGIVPERCYGSVVTAGASTCAVPGTAPAPGTAERG